jgi:predicted NUDIX family NTP pyrophosphohydrolase
MPVDMPGKSHLSPRPRSAGILLYRRVNGELEVLLVHPGGPFWARRDAGVWSIPKGEYEPGEEPLDAARREFEEELGSPPPPGQPVDLGEVRQKAGKLVRAWALTGDLDVDRIQSNTFAMQWPPGSGRMQEFPEVDRGQWFATDQAREKINPAQIALLERLEEIEGAGG